MAGTVRESKTILTAEDKTAGAFASMQRNVEATTSRISGMQAAFAGLAGVVVGGAFAAMIKGSIDATARFKDLAEEAGTTASNLSKFEAPARMAGLGLDTVAAAMFKLSKAALEAKDPTSRAAQALGAIGISTQQLKNLKPDEMFELIARQSAKYGDGLEKNAVFQELLGKSGREMSRVLKEVAEAAALHATVTNQQAEEADKLGDQLIELQMNSEKLWRSLLGEAVPAINEVIKAFIDAKKEGGFLNGVIAGLSATMEAAFGKSLPERLADVNERIANIGKMTAKWKTAEQIEEIKKLNYYLQLRAGIESEIFAKELEAQNRRATAPGGGKPAPQFDPVAAAAAAAAARKAEADALKEAEKALRDYVKAAMDALAADEETAKQLADLDKKRVDAILSTEKVIAQIEFETTLIGLNNDEREKAIALRALENSGIDKQSKDFANLKERLVAALDQQKAVRDEFAAMQQQAAMWDEMGERAGAFFGDLVVNGKSAFDRLRDSLKSFAAEIIALFAKRYVLQMIAGVTGSSLAGNAAASVGANSIAGSALSAGASWLGSTALGAGFAQGAGTGAGIWAGAGYGEAALTGMGAVGGAMGSAASALMTAMPYLAAIAAAYLLIKKFGDKGENPKAQLGFGAGAQAYVTNGVFGAEGFKSIQTDDAFNQSLRAYFASFKGMDEALAKMLTDSQKTRISAALGSASQYEFAFPKGDQTAGEQLSLAYLKSKYGAVFDELDKTFADFVKNFTGSAEDLQKAIANEAAVLGMLKDAGADLLGKLPDLTVDGLRKVQQAGEELSDTFTRVVNEFLTAQAALNQAIASRNPAFARDLVLGQRNSIGAQFGALIGQQYGAGLATQMATNPQSFTGLGTEGMSLLAQWLGLQTTLEQLDAQLSNTTTPAINDFTAAVVNSASAMSSAIGGLASYLRGSLLGDLSPLSPQARYAEAKKQFNDNLTLAQGGNIDAISSFGTYRDQFLSASRAVNASSGQYNTDFFGSFNAGAALTGGAVRPYTAADANVNTSAIVAAIAATASGQQVTNTILVDYLNELAQGNTSQNSSKIVELLGMLNDRVRINGGALTSGSGALA